MEEKVGVVHISNGYLKVWPHPQQAGQLPSKCHCQAIRKEAEVHKRVCVRRPDCKQVNGTHYAFLKNLTV